MKQLTGNQVRQMFLDYFKSKGHMIEPGASLIPHNDPTLLWINAGVAALKKYFDDIDFQSLDKNNPITLQIMSNSIYCENFILIDWIKKNFNIVYFGE